MKYFKIESNDSVAFIPMDIICFNFDPSAYEDAGVYNVSITYNERSIPIRELLKIDDIDNLMKSLLVGDSGIKDTGDLVGY